MRAKNYKNIQQKSAYSINFEETKQTCYCRRRSCPRIQRIRTKTVRSCCHSAWTERTPVSPRLSLHRSSCETTAAVFSEGLWGKKKFKAFFIMFMTFLSITKSFY